MSLYAPLLWPDEPNYCIELSDSSEEPMPHSGVHYMVSDEETDEPGIFLPSGEYLVFRKKFGFA